MLGTGIEGDVLIFCKRINETRWDDTPDERKETLSRSMSVERVSNSQDLLGENMNAGQKITLKLRTEDVDGFRPPLIFLPAVLSTTANSDQFFDLS